MSKSSSSSHKKTTSLESVSSELNVLDLANELHYFIQTGNHKGAISVLRHDPLLANHVYNSDNIQDTVVTRLERATPLSLACYYGNYEIIKELLKKQYNIDVNFKSSYNMTPLLLVDGEREDANYYSIIKKLIQNGADINNMSSDGDTIFKMVLGADEIDDKLVDYLLKNHDLDLNKKLDGGDGIIHKVLIDIFYYNDNSEYLSILKKILKKDGLDINSKGEGGDTVLHILANEDRKQEPGYSVDKLKELIILFIEKGINPNIKNDRGKLALENDVVREIYNEYVLSKVKKLQANQRLAFAKMMIDENHEDTPNDVIIKILKSLEIPPLNKETLEKTNKLLFKQQLQEELKKEIEKQIEKELKEKMSKELYKSFRSQFPGENIDDMIEFYRKLLRDPNLTQAQRRAYKKQKRTRKKKLGIKSGSSDLNTSELELKRAVEMSIEEYNKDSSGSKKKKKKKMKKSKRKRKSSKKSK